MKVPVEKQEPSFDETQSVDDGVENNPLLGDMGNSNSELNTPDVDDDKVGGNPYEASFDAEVDANEDEDPKKYIQQLTGKLAQKLRDYNSTENDGETNKFVINSLIPASIPSLDDSDIKDVIDKIKDNNGENGDASDGVENNENNNDGNDEKLDNNDLFNDDKDVSDDPQMEEDIDIDNLVNEILSGRKKNTYRGKKNPFKPKKFN